MKNNCLLLGGLVLHKNISADNYISKEVTLESFKIKDGNMDFFLHDIRELRTMNVKRKRTSLKRELVKSNVKYDKISTEKQMFYLKINYKKFKNITKM